MKKRSGCLLILLFFCKLLFSQVGINSEGTPPDGSAMLDVRSTTKGFLPPRMTMAQRDAIQNPAEGLVVFCTDCDYGNIGAVTVYANGNWKIVYSYCLVYAPEEGAHVPAVTQILWKWSPAEYAAGYKWNYYDNYSTAIDVGMNTSYEDTELVCGTYYHAYVWAYNVCGDWSVATPLSQATLPILIDSPTQGTHIPYEYGITWKWNAVEGATGYKWNYVDDYATAYDRGTDLQLYESDLYCNLLYNSYVWAYSDCGVSAPAMLTQLTLPCFACGAAFTVYHHVGSVAPMTKTVSYGTATGIPGETSKCWITSNLGADHQATSVSDPTEASGGWYWQFNLKRGYMFYGTTLTPSWQFSALSQVTDWMPANDPCSWELGGGWRIPTYDEWHNVFTAGGWSDWTGPWNSGLKLHAAGYLSSADGYLYEPGVSGTYWSSSRNTADWGETLEFGSSYARIYSWEMAYGYSVRCISDPDKNAVSPKPEKPLRGKISKTVTK